MYLYVCNQKNNYFDVAISEECLFMYICVYFLGIQTPDLRDPCNIQILTNRILEPCDFCLKLLQLHS